MKELISVIVPVYNVEKMLNKCVDSILNQSYSNLEIILVDDGSTDKSGKICDYYEKNDKRIKCIHKINGGLSSARNCGINNSNGNYLCFIDSDDFIDVNLIEKLYISLLSNGSDISMSNRKNYFDNGKEYIRFANCGEKVFSKIEAIEEMNLYNYFDMSSCGKIFKKSLFKEIRFPEGKLCEDYYIMYKLLDNCNKVSYVSDIFYYYYQRSGSISKNVNINWDFVYAALEQEKFINDKYKTLRLCANYAVAFAYLTIYDIVLKNNGTIPESVKKEIVNNIKGRIKLVFKYKKTSYIKKIQITLFVYCTGIYNLCYKLLKKMRGE